MTKKFLIISGLTLIVMAMVLGAIYGAYTLPRVLEQRKSHLINVVEFQKEGEIEMAKAAVSGFEKVVAVKERVSSAHAHLALLGTIAVLLGLISPFIGISPTVKLLVGILYVLGSLLLPLGVFFEALGKPYGVTIALTGGVGVLLATTLFLAIFILYEQQATKDR